MAGLTADDERVVVLRRGFGAWSDGDPEAVVAMFHPDAEWHLSGIFPDFTGTLHGRQAILDMWHDFTEPWERIELDPTRFHSVGDWVLAEVRFTAVGRDGVRVELPQVHSARFRDGLVMAYRSHRELGEALAAAARD